MDRPDQLTALQVDLTDIFFSLDAAKGYLVAGGAALLASDLIARPTADLDLFTAIPTTSPSTPHLTASRPSPFSGRPLRRSSSPAESCSHSLVAPRPATSPTCTYSRNASARTPSSSRRKLSTQDSTSTCSRR